MKEEKKYIRIKLSTSVVLIVLIMILSVISIFVLTESIEKDKLEIENSKQKVQESVNKNTIVNDEIVDKENNTEKQESQKKSNKTKGSKLIQFDEEFYKLEDIALEYRECGDIKNYKDFEYDFDGDGQKDIITIKNIGKTEDSGEYDVHEIKLNNKTFYTDRGYDLVSVYIVDLNESDKTIQVIIRISGPNDMKEYYIYGKKGSKMNLLKEIDGWWCVKINKKGKFVINNALLEGINPEIYDIYYEFKNDKIEEEQANIEKIKNMKLKSEGWMCFTTEKNGLKKYQEHLYKDENEDYDNALEEYGINKFEKEFNFELIRFEKGTWVNGAMYVKLEDGRKGYLFSFAYNLAG